MPVAIPVLLAYAATALTVVSAGASIAGGVMAIKSGEEESKAAKEQAKAEGEAARAEALVKKNELARVQSATRAHFASLGTDPDTGSAFAVQQYNERMGAIDIGFGESQRRMNAFALRQRGKAAKTQGILSGVGSFIDAAQTGLEGYSSYQTFKANQKKTG